MTDEKKKPRSKRPQAEVLADLKRRTARIESAGLRKALELVRGATVQLEEAQAACGDGAHEAAPMWKTAQNVLGQIDSAIGKAIPPEAR